MILVPLATAIVSLGAALVLKTSIFSGDSGSMLLTYEQFTFTGLALILYVSYKRFRGE
jgi:hypothetical protein